MTQTAERAVATQPFAVFDVRVARTVRLGPTFVRVTFTGDQLDRFADNGFDQRIKLFFPLADGRLPDLPRGADWYQQWRALPDAERPPIRTYTVREVRPAARELDVDMVLHGDGGPASRWLAAARPGDRLTVLGPNADHDGVHGGIDFVPPTRTGCVLLAGDETAVPAIAAILERLPADASGEVLLEVPASGDAMTLAAPAGVVVRWLGRDGAAHGELLQPAVQAAADRLIAGSAGRTCSGSCTAAHPLREIDVDTELLWEVPVDGVGRPLAACLDLYIWLAGEAAVIKALRRHLVTERGVDRSAVAFMGYWRRGRAENG
ncbi:siderophore-interacting protein [Pengzhenrongella sicca]|uniref:Siderophore-interacting protein n=1 Tax=Pengzhenrongella sicca TaxID=2819238 RepID=A0A8A4ZCC8_9MICO|nr:siderophore-interacting protein [Pengzhenrongella sicca]QTE29582.1 siderophore-interacting protein [Pengzhenrongella sicca]